MSNVNATLALARRALLAQQAALAVTGDNIANVNTPGYARRRGHLTPGPILQTAQGSFGSGVELRNVQSIRDPFIERQVRRTMADAGRYQEGNRQLQMIEGVLGEIGDAGLSAALDRFWNSWHDLAADPSSRGARSIVREVARGLVDRFQTIDARLADQEQQINNLIAGKIDRVNALLRQVASLNREMRYQVEGGQIDDQRTQILDELARLAGATYRPQADGSVSVMIGGQALVEGEQLRELIYNRDQRGRPVMQPLIAGGATPLIESGEIAGLTSVRDDETAELRANLDEIARALASEVNRIHTGGYDLSGNPAAPFFNPETTGALNFGLSAEVERDPGRIAASLDGRSGDNRIALAIADLELAPLAINGQQTIGDAYRGIVTELGARIKENEMMTDAAMLSQEQMESWRESVSGVSMDEEMANLIRYENAFNAAAKLTQVLSQMMDTVLSIGA